MKFMKHDANNHNINAEIEYLKSEKERKIGALQRECKELEQKEENIYCAIGMEAYARFSAGYDECDLMEHFTKVKEIQSQLEGKKKEIADVTNHCEKEIAVLHQQVVDVPKHVEEQPPVFVPSPPYQVDVFVPIETSPQSSEENQAAFEAFMRGSTPTDYEMDKTVMMDPFGLETDKTVVLVDEPIVPSPPYQVHMPAIPIPQESPKALFCDFCGGKVMDGDMFCQTCGKKL